MSDDGSEGSATPPRPQRRIKKVMVLSSASETESDESEGPTRTRKRRLRVVSDDEGSSSSGSSVGARRRRALPQLRDSDADSDSSTGTPAAPKPTSGFASDSSEGNSDKCSICLMRFTDQEVGTPVNCEHMFCLDCITEWSKNVNTCPVDRITFESIVVRTCAGGRVLRSDPVQVTVRRPSVEMLVIEDLTACEICGSMEDEDSMLLCDGCDLGFHMQCLTPPMRDLPLNQWHCPSCRAARARDFYMGRLEDMMYLSEVGDLFTGIADIELPRGPRAAPLRQPQEVRRSSRNQPGPDEPSTSSGRGGGPAARDAADAPAERDAPVTSRASRARAPRAPPRRRRKPARTRTKTVIIEYEVEENGKFPVTRRVKKTVRKRKTRRRRPRTVARRTHVRASVRAQLAALAAPAHKPPATSSSGVSELHVQRVRAGIPALSLFGSERQLEYFSDDDAETSQAAATAGVVARAVRPTHAAFSAYRQARRKMVSVPSPPPASAAPDLLSDILESQTLLHSRRAALSVGPDGRVDIRPRGGRGLAAGGDRVDVHGGAGAVRSAPAHPGQRGGWGGGYSGNYHREQSANNFGRGYADNYGPNGGDAPAYPARPHGYGGRRDDEHWGGFPRRAPAPPPPHPRPAPPCLRPRRPSPRRHSAGPAWRPARPDLAPPAPHRHSMGGLENPLDMRVAPQARPAPAPAHAPPDDRPFRPLPEPPVFAFGDLPEDKSEDEKSDSSLVIDTEKYDPTEPTRDDDSGEEAAAPAPAPAPAPAAPVFGPLPAPPTPPALASPPKSPGPAAAPLPPTPPPPAPVPPAPPLPAGLLDTAVRQVLREHRALMEPAAPRSDDDDSDGDCPNFSIYSATSVHIASAGSLAPPTSRTRPHLDMADLVQEDDEPLPKAPAPVDKDEQYKERVSKRCPITPNKREPIKIKLNTPSLIKRVSLYDEEDVAVQGEEPIAEAEPGAPEPAADDAKAEDDPPEPEDDKDTDKVAVENDKEDDKDEDDKEEDDKDEDDKDEDDKEHDEKIVEDEPKKSEDEGEASSDEAKVGSTTPKDESPDRESLHDAPSSSEKQQNGLCSPRSSRSRSPRSPAAPEKMTESISETEDERSYTPCLDENQSKDTSRGSELRLEGEALGTELISEDEANGVFSDAGASPPPTPQLDGKKKKRKESKKDGKSKSKGKKDVAFRKLSKAGRERSYRDKGVRRRSASGSPRRAASERRRREKRKDLERYDVRSVVTEKRKKLKDPFGRDVSPARSGSGSPRRSLSRPQRSPSRSRLTPSPRPRRASLRSLTPLSPRPSPPRRSPSPRRIRKRRKSPTPRRRSASPRRRTASPRRRTASPRRRSASPRRRSPRRRDPSPARARKRRRSASPKTKVGKKKKRARSPVAAPTPRRRSEPRRKSPKRKKKRRSPQRSPSPAGVGVVVGAGGGWSPLSVDSRLLSPRTPPPDAAPPRRLKRKRKEPRRAAARHKRPKDTAAPSKEVFTSGDNILVSVSFAEQQTGAGAGAGDRRAHKARRDKRRRRRVVPADDAAAKPVAIIDLERSPFRELTPSPKNVIVLSDSDHGDKEPPAAAAPEPAAAVGPKTPPSPAAPAAPPPVKFSLAAKPGAAPRPPNPLLDEPPAAPPAAPAAPGTPPGPPDSPDAYDPFEPTRSASASPARAASPAPPAASPERPSMTLEAAQRTNMSADEVLARRPLSPIEKVMALLQSTRDESPEPVPAAPHAPHAAPPTPAPPASNVAALAPTQRIVLPSPTRAQPKLFLAKPSPIKSNPIKPMQATKISLLPLPRHEGGDSPYSPGSSDFGDLFSPPPAGKRDAFDSLFAAKPTKRRDKAHAKVPVKFNRKKGKTQVGVKLDDDNLKILDELPSSAVEMQVKNKFLKKLNRQERVVEEVKLVLKPHYTRKRVSKEEYKDILRRAVPKICHNKTGEINPAKIQALVEAYVKKARKKHKLGLA